MENVKKQICRLCLRVIPAGMGEVIEKTSTEKLKVLLINIDFDISDNAIACNGCLEKLQDCFDFISTCSYVDNYSVSCKNVDIKVEINTISEKEMSKESVNLENVQMCRWCMSLIKDEYFNCSTDSKEDFFLKDMLKNCVLKVDLNTAHVPLICKRCLSSAKKYSEFMETCREVEERIKNYCQVGEGYGVRARVILENVLEFNNCGLLSKPTVIKKECFDVENEDMTAMECFKGENTASIKCKEIDIKDELDIKVETSESVPSGNCNNFGRNGSSKRKRCAKTEEKQILQRGQCYLCSFVTDNRSLLNAHMMCHKGSAKAFSCHQCSYETNRKSNLKQHFISHKDKSEVEMHKCPLCPYRNKYKGVVAKHQKLKHYPKTKVYNCKYCSYSTMHKDHSARHQLMHENPEKILKHKCEKCEYKTRYKSNLTLHMVVHDDSALFKCEKCPHQSKRQSDFKKHVMTHSSEKRYSCEQCTYCSSFLNNLRRHMVVHQADCKATRYWCDQCDFQTKYKTSLRSHKQRHDATQPMFKCDKCKYSTIEKNKLKHHQVKHMKLGDTMVYYCLTCNFKTKYKYALPRHMIRAKKCLRTKKIDDNKIKKDLISQSTLVT